MIGRHAALVLQDVRPEWSVRWTTDLAEGVDGADVVVPLVRIGGPPPATTTSGSPSPSACGDWGIGPGGMANACGPSPHCGPWPRSSPPWPRRVRGQPDGTLASPPVPCRCRAGLHGRVRTADRGPPPTAGPRAGRTGRCHPRLARLRRAKPPLVVLAHHSRGDAHGTPGGPRRRTRRRRDVGPVRRCPDAVLLPGPRTGPGAALGIRQPADAGPSGRAVRAPVERMPRQPGRPVPELAERPTPWFDLALVPVLAGWWGGRPSPDHSTSPTTGSLAVSPTAWWQRSGPWSTAGGCMSPPRRTLRGPSSTSSGTGPRWRACSSGPRSTRGPAAIAAAVDVFPSTWIRTGEGNWPIGDRRRGRCGVSGDGMTGTA